MDEEKPGEQMADDSLAVLDSSVKMFGLVKQSINRCTALNTGQAFFDMYKEFRQVVSEYAGALAAKLPRFTKHGDSWRGDVCRFNEHDEQFGEGHHGGASKTVRRGSAPGVYVVCVACV